MPVNKVLLERRDQLQLDIDAWHRGRRGQPFDVAAHEAHLVGSGYRVPEGPDFRIGTQNVDAEIARLAGPQLVVPLSNARYALNAANARWGSLYDALYGTDAIEDSGELARGTNYNALRGRKVIERVRAVLDQAVPLASGSHRNAIGYSIAGGALQVALSDGPSQASPGRRSSKASSVRKLPRPHCCSRITACTSRCASIARIRSAATTRLALPTSSSNRP